MTRRTVWIVAVCVVIVMLASIAYRVAFPATFDSARWQNADSPSQFIARRDMLPDVQRLLIEATVRDTESAKRILGPPERQADAPEQTTWYYDLGGEPGRTAPGPEQWLTLTFDGSGKLIAHRVTNEWLPASQPSGAT